MKVIFFGTPEFAIPSLKILYDNGYEISAVVTVPDKEKGRGLKPEPSPVKKVCAFSWIKSFRTSQFKR